MTSKRTLPALPTRYLCFVSLIVISGACYNQVLLNADSIAHNNASDIVVSTKDGRRVSFSTGSYTVTTDTAGQKVLKGIGRVQPRVSAQDEPFAGEIPIDEIDTVYSSEKSAIFYVSIVTGVAATALVVVLVITFRGGVNLGG